ncbi:hypothetical protein [Bradyrhizobium ottawaense]|uniref:hypothetical protein n=1 Tax=Bradyrhizobium ottawaense TaxID=931866 RepID=UPI0030F48132
MSVPFLSVKPRAIRLKVSPRFPAQLVGRNGIDVAKQDGNYYLDLDYNDFPVIGSVPSGTTHALIFDPATGKYAQLPTALLGGAGGVPEAPNDGFLYQRKNLAWVRAPREVLIADRTYFVRTDGSNSNNGLANTAGGAFLTVQKAVDVVCSLDMSIYQVTIQVGPGTYSGGVTLTPAFGAKPPAIVGDTTTPANVVFSNNNDVVFIYGPTNAWRIGGIKLTATSGHGLRCGQGANLIFEKMDFGSFGSSYSHIYAESMGLIQGGYAFFTYTISGGAAVHANAAYGGFITLPYNTVTLTGTPAFAVFATAIMAGQLRADSMAFTGSATGKRYEVMGNGIINGTSGNASYFPGSAAGTTATGGLYL